MYVNHASQEGSPTEIKIFRNKNVGNDLNITKRHYISVGTTLHSSLDGGGILVIMITF